MKLKVCGMKFPENIIKIESLKPDFMGFIFWNKSVRHYDKTSISISSEINRVGVFVNEKIEEVLKKIKQYNLDFVQLHGGENEEYCRAIKDHCKIIKVFSISKGFEFKDSKPFENLCHYFLFDTKSSSYGGSGEKFDWTILNNYNSKKSFFLSGGISLDDIDEIKIIFNSKLPLLGIDINSQFENKLLEKDYNKIKLLIKNLKNA
ncbi:MAG: phosphoribosylanthranilate isomerase [Bacteroidetes bacterium]|jgi:phosphoribosylanthranilate isomerase|nr:phosphoribosylanthranilate isomerase [Bacteroidota bacterium]MDA0995267.1 phosphoribosylanthranilate isomerase [Pseudomonadota bacterium]|tara:strand:- start:52425 stop:53039 length:615 start_codon:yes stop_codon:yes gene_type:complete